VLKLVIAFFTLLGGTPELFDLSAL